MGSSLSDFGSYTVGGRIHRVTEGTPRTVSFARGADYTVDPRGRFWIEQTYVQFFVPAVRRDVPPAVLVHGGGMHGSTWETTPDGRPGWIHRLLERGHEVHVVDMVERGRSGFAPGVWPDAPFLRSMEEAWHLFRFGPADGFADRRPFPGQQFPTDRLDDLCRRFVPRWLSTGPLQTDGLIAVLERTGPALVISHSQGGEIAFDAATRRPDRVAAMIAVEPSALPQSIEPLARTPLALLAGDFLDTDARWAERRDGWADLIARLKASGAPAQYLATPDDLPPGGSHLLMMDRHGDACLDAALNALSGSLGPVTLTPSSAGKVAAVE